MNIVMTPFTIIVHPVVNEPHIIMIIVIHVQVKRLFFVNDVVVVGSWQWFVLCPLPFDGSRTAQVFKLVVYDCLASAVNLY